MFYGGAGLGRSSTAGTGVPVGVPRRENLGLLAISLRHAHDRAGGHNHAALDHAPYARGPPHVRGHVPFHVYPHGRSCARADAGASPAVAPAAAGTSQRLRPLSQSQGPGLRHGHGGGETRCEGV